MIEILGLIFLVALALFNVHMLKYCWDFIPKTDKKQHKAWAGMGVLAFACSLLTCVLYLVAYLIL